MYEVDKWDKGICTSDKVYQAGNKNEIKDNLYPEVNCDASMIILRHFTADKKKTDVYNNQKTGHKKQW
jgi:hypothetical protein